MHPERIIAALGLPPESRAGQRVPKKLLLEHGAPTAADKRHIQEGIEIMTWAAALKPANAGLAAFRDASRDYGEIVVLTVQFRPGAKAARLVALIHRAIPYPLLLIGVEEAGTTVSLAHKRFSQAESGRFVVEGLKCTEALPSEPSPEQEAFLDALPLRKQQVHDLYTLYQAWLHCVDALAVAHITGAYPPVLPPVAAKAREAALDTYTRLEGEIAGLRTQAAKEKQMNRRVELNLEIQRLEKELVDTRILL